MIDIHCHLLPEVDDGATSWEISLEMARIAVRDGIRTVIATPHQLGNYRQNNAEMIRSLVDQLQQRLQAEAIPLCVLPGADVRIEPDMMTELVAGQVLSLAERQYVLLELPHEIYFPLQPVLEQLSSIGMIGILSHPERNQGILAQPKLLAPLVEAGCLMQVTAGSLLGAFGPASRQLSESMLGDGLVHFIATDAHGSRARRPRLRPAHDRVAELTDADYAFDLCVRFPQMIVDGAVVPTGRRPTRRQSVRSWFRRAKSA